jgi:hypothetical protein
VPKVDLSLLSLGFEGDGYTSGTNCVFKTCGIVDPPDVRVAVRSRKRLVEQDQRVGTVQHQIARMEEAWTLQRA